VWPPDGPARARGARAGKSSVSARFDRVFWLGDFNYRVNGNRAIVDKLLAPKDEAEAREAGWASAEECARESLRVLARNDQLGLQMRGGFAFRGFAEGELTFRPTYKFDSKQKDVYDRSEKARIPAWTDRVLFRSRPAQPRAIELHYYSSIDELNTSDHRPVLADLSVRYEYDAPDEPPASEAEPPAANGIGKEPPQLGRSYSRGGGACVLNDPKPEQADTSGSATCVIS
jgi:hypothetical protein